MMDDVVSDSSMMKVFTEPGHYQNISVIFMTQNVFDQKKADRIMFFNTGYVLLFENARDRQQNKTLAKQMYAENWSSFMVCTRQKPAHPMVEW